MSGLIDQRALDRAVAQSATLRERITEELGFAEGLLKLHPDQAGQWAPLIEHAHALFQEAAAGGSIDRLTGAVEAAEAILAPIGEVAKTYTLRCVGHAHIDMNWMWSWPETVAVANDTFTTALQLMEEFPDFCLTQSQGAIYEIIRRHNPELFERIKARVKEGRWEVAAASWVEGDKNISSGESLAHHLLLTRRYMKEHLGLTPEEVSLQWEPDTFGHAHSIPMIVSQGGVKCYYLCRGGEKELPPIFWWNAPDGSRVLVNRETDWYNNTIAPHAARKLLKFCESTGLRDWMFVYGVGDHGGGPTRRDLRRCHELDAWPIYPRFRFATAKSCMARILEEKDRWPSIDRELNFEFAGCYTSQSSIKKANRAGENLLVEAESAAALARAALQRPVPHELLRDAWLDVLFGQFHDILPGSGVRATRDYNQGLFQKLSAEAGMVKTQSLRALAGAVDTTFAQCEEGGEGEEEVHAHGSMGGGGGAGRVTEVTGMNGAGRMTEIHQISSASHVCEGPRPIVVFNPSAWAREEIVTVALWDGDADYTHKKLNQRRFVVRTPDGQRLPTQLIASGNYWGHEFVDLAFPARVGPLAYAAYSIEEVPADSPDAQLTPPVSTTATAETEGGWKINQPVGRLTMENEHLLVEFDRRTGGIQRLVEKKSGQNLASEHDPLGLLEYVLERPQGMSAWILGDPKKRVFPLEADSVRISYTGPYLAAVTATVRIEQSKFDVVYSLKAGQRTLGIDITGTWLERGGPEIGTPKLLIRFPLHLTETSARYEIPFGAIRRDQNNGRELPALRWVDVDGTLADAGAGAPAGLALLNDCKHGHSLEGSVLRQTLIRSSYDPDPLPEMGDHRIRLALVPHAGQASAADLIRWGADHNHPLICVNTAVHGGKLPAQVDAIIASQTPGVLVTHIKQAADDGGLVLRLQETAGQSGNAVVALNRQVLGGLASATLVDLLERPMEGAKAISVKEDRLSVPMQAFGIASVLLRGR
jgi:alpha-mannosidase